MPDDLTVDALRAAIQHVGEEDTTADDRRFELMARRFELAVQHLVAQVQKVVEQIPELEMHLEDEVEAFSAPGYPGRTLEIHDQRLRITRGSDTLLFDPTAKALLSALGQIEIFASRPIPFMVEKVLYLIPTRGGAGARWGYRSVDSLGGPVVPFTQQDLLRLLKAVFAAAD